MQAVTSTDRGSALAKDLGLLVAGLLFPAGFNSVKACLFIPSVSQSVILHLPMAVFQALG